MQSHAAVLILVLVAITGTIMCNWYNQNCSHQHYDDSFREQMHQKDREKEIYLTNYYMSLLVPNHIVLENEHNCIQ